MKVEWMCVSEEGEDVSFFPSGNLIDQMEFVVTLLLTFKDLKSLFCISLLLKPCVECRTVGPLALKFSLTQRCKLVKICP